MERACTPKPHGDRPPRSFLEITPTVTTALVLEITPQHETQRVLEITPRHETALVLEIAPPPTAYSAGA